MTSNCWTNIVSSNAANIYRLTTLIDSIKYVQLTTYYTKHKNMKITSNKILSLHFTGTIKSFTFH